MARIESTYKIVDGQKYFTSNHLANKYFIDKRTARNFLKSYPSLEGSKNPRLYEEEVMKCAVDDYEEKTTPANREKFYEKIRAAREDSFYSSQILEELSKLEVKRKELEEYKDADPETQHKLDELRKQTEYEIEHKEAALEAAKKEFATNLPTMLLKHLLYVQGYSFNEEQYKRDLELHHLSELFREAGVMRSEEHRKAVKRLESNKGYLMRK
ncbi:hypothetical protein AB1I63_09750 [Streptococcus pneumoniae]